LRHAIGNWRFLPALISESNLREGAGTLPISWRSHRIYLSGRRADRI